MWWLAHPSRAPAAGAGRLKVTLSK